MVATLKLLHCIQILFHYTEVDNRALPSITTNPTSMTVELHDRISLNCSATGNPTPNIRWYKDGTLIEGPQAIGDVFVIPETTPNERGFYQCEAFSSFGQPSRSMKALILIQGGIIIIIVYSHCTIWHLSVVIIACIITLSTVRAVACFGV